MGWYRMKKKTYLKMQEYNNGYTISQDFSIFEGDIVKDKKYEKDILKRNTRYFELKEVE